MASIFSDRRNPGIQQDQGRADAFQNQSQALPSVSHFHPSFPGAAALLRPTWAVADDIFWERYGTALRGTEGSWRALPHLRALSGQVHTAHSTTPFQGPREDYIDGPSSAIDPWLLQPSPHVDSPSVAGVGGRPGHPQLPPAASASHRHLLFQYKPYCHQDPLHLSEQDVAAVLEVAFGKIHLGAPKDSSTNESPAGGGAALPRPSSSLWGGAVAGGGGGSTIGGGAGMNQSPSDVACVVLVKLIMDLYLSQGPQLTFSMVNFMLQRALACGDGTAHARVFDLIMNLAVHGELLYDAPGDQVPEDDAAVVEAVAKLDRAGPSADWRHTVTSALRASLAAGLETPTSAGGGGRGGGFGRGAPSGVNTHNQRQGHQQEIEEEEIEGNGNSEWPPLPRPSPIGLSAAHGIDPRGQRFRQWLRLLLFRMLSVLCSVSTSEAAWAAAASCLAVLSTHEGHVVRSFIQEMPLEAAAVLLEQSKKQEWPHSFRCWIGCLAANLMYSKKASTKNNSSTVSGGSGKSSALDESSFCLDASKMKAFGGIRAVIRKYLDAPTLRCRRAFFCVMFDYLVTGGGGGGGGGGEAAEDEEEEIDTELETSLSQARSLLRAVHTSQIDAMGAALLYTRAAEALCPVFKLSFSSYHSAGSNNALSSQVLHGVAADITAQIAAVHAVYPTQVVQPPPGLVEQSLNALLTMTAVAAAGDCHAVTPIAAAGEGIGNEDETLCTALKEGIVGSDTRLLRMLIEAADKEVAAAVAAGRQPTALLPPPAAGLGKKASIASNLEQSLPDIRGHAANAFTRAVHALLDYAQLATAGLAATSSSWPSVSFTSVALQTLTVAIEWLNLAPPVARQRALAAAAEHAVALLTVRKIDPGDDGTALSSLDRLSSTSGTISTNFATNAQAGAYSTQNVLTTGGAGISGIAAGRTASGEGQPQQQQQQQQQQVSSHVAGQQASEYNAIEGRAEQPGGHKQSSPLSKLMPVPKLTAAWRRLTNPHHGDGGNGGGGEARQQQQSVQTQGRTGIPEPGSSSVEEPVRPLSAGLSSLSGAERDAMAAAAAAAAAAPALGRPPRSPAASQHQVQQQQPVYQQAHRSRQFSNDVSLLSLAAERALYEMHAADAAAQYGAEAVAVAETKLTSIDSFLSGLSELIPGILSTVPPELLRNIMEGLKPETLLSPSGGGGGGSLGGGGGGSPGSVRSVHGKAESQSRLSAVQAGRPLWDARAAIAILLLKQEEKAASTKISSPPATGLDISFIASLLSDSDPRVRRHASMFILTRFAQEKSQQYRTALREVVAKAQKGDDVRLLTSAEAQVKAMLEARLMSLEGLV